MDTIGFALCAAYARSLTRIFLGFFNNADAFEPGLVSEHLDDLIEGGAVVRYQYFADSSHCLNVLVFGRLDHILNYFTMLDP